MTAWWRLVAGAIATVVGVGGWVASATVGADEDGGPATLDGATTFRLRGCASCHIGPSATPSMEVGPPLDDAATWAGERRPGVDAAEYLEESLRSPAAYIASGSMFGMPLLPLTDEEIDALVTYLLDG